jgi:hypothetical protein
MPACTACGEQNPDRARFCLACGAPIKVAEAPPRPGGAGAPRRHRAEVHRRRGHGGVRHPHGAGGGRPAAGRDPEARAAFEQALELLDRKGNLVLARRVRAGLAAR